ncbi:MAG TPA: biotin/lipoyl-binding protein, partial [Bryobacteraceae bacterium]|nr:biotin/lipoyl-binding protein [Bryobacteraceae bacterium]
MATHVSDLDKRNVTPVEEEGTPPEPPAGAPNPRLRMLLIAVLLIAIAVAAWFYFSTRNRVSTDDAQVDGHIVPMAAKISGSVEAVMVDDNQPVKAGDVLVRIDPRDYQARLDQARAALAMGESQARGAQVAVPLTNATTETGMSS